jgi:hypothetical protein
MDTRRVLTVDVGRCCSSVGVMVTMTWTGVRKRTDDRSGTVTGHYSGQKYYSDRKFTVNKIIGLRITRAHTHAHTQTHTHTHTHTHIHAHTHTQCTYTHKHKTCSRDLASFLVGEDVTVRCYCLHTLIYTRTCSLHTHAHAFAFKSHTPISTAITTPL